MEKIYVPSNMLIDTDVGLCRFLMQGQPYVPDRIRRILRDREEEIPIEEFIEKYPVIGKASSFSNEAYRVFFEDDKLRKTIFSLSPWNDKILSIVTSSYAFGLNNQIQCIIGYDYNEELDIIEKSLEKARSKVNVDIPTIKNSDVNISDFDTIFVKVLDESYVNYLIDNNTVAKKIYVADYRFNTINDGNYNKTVPFRYLSELERYGNIIYTISVYDDKL